MKDKNNENDKNFDTILEEYSLNSFFIFSRKNRFRIFLIKIKENKYFEIGTQVLIVINSLIMLLYTYKLRICDRDYQKNSKEYFQCKDQYKSKIERDDILEKIFIVFNGIFGLEILIKMFAQGLIMHKGAYLRNGWNIIDCFVTVYSFIKLSFPDLGNLTVLRVIRLIRVLRSISVLSGIRRLITSIIISLPMLGNVLLFLCFIFLIFGILGIQIFSGVFYNRCRTNPILVDDNYKGIPKYRASPVTEKICSPEGKDGTFKCPTGSICVNFYDIPEYFNMTNVTIDSFDIEDEGLKYNAWLYYGLFNFDNIINCIINAFSFMTIQNWADDLTKLLDGCSSFSSRLYFNFVVIIGGFFIIKLILAAQNEALTKVNKEEVEARLKQLNMAEQKNDFVLSRDQVKSLVDAEDQDINPILQKKLTKKSMDSGLKTENNNLTPSFSNGIATNQFSSFGNQTSKDPSPRKQIKSVCFNMGLDEKKSSGISGKPLSKNEIQELTDSKLVQFIKLKSLHQKENSSVQAPINEISYPVGLSQEIQRTNNMMITDGELSPTGSQNQYFLCEKPLNSTKPLKPSIKKNPLIQFEHNNIFVISNPIYQHQNSNIKKSLINHKSKYVDMILYDYYNLMPPPIHSSSSLQSSMDESEGTSKPNNLIFQVKKLAVSKIKYMILEEYSHTYQYIIFNCLIYLVTTLNIVFMCLMSYPMSEKLSNIMNIVNIVCSSIFVLEMIFKILVLGCKGWVKDKLNIADFVVVFLGIFEIIYVKCNKDKSDDSNSSLSALRAIRYIRILKLSREGSFIQKFVEFIIISLRDLIYYCLLLIFFIYIFAIAGRELFAYSVVLYNDTDEYGYKFNTTRVPRENFDSILNSLVTVFIFFIGDNWPEIMYEFSKKNRTLSEIYFLGIIIFGNIMLFNLFLSILMSNYEIDDRIELFVKAKNDGGIIKTTFNKLQSGVKEVREKVETRLKKWLDCCIKDESDKKASIERRRKNIIAQSYDEFAKQLEESKNKIPVVRTSLMIFSNKNKFRLFCSKLIQESKVFHFIIYITISISLILLALDAPSLTNMTMKKVILSLDILTNIIFLFEALIKMVAFGFLFNGEYSYLRYEYNFFDFTSLVLSILYIVATSKSTLKLSSITDESKSTQIFRVIKLLRLLRITKLFELSKSLQAALAAFYESVKQMLKIIFIGSLFILMFTIIGINYFRGRFARCNFNRVPDLYMYNITTKWDCMDYGGDWVNPYPNLDNVKTGFILFFEMMTTEQWTSYMYMAMDATEINKQPIRDHSYRWCLFFVLYMVFAYFFLLNLAIAILSDNFNKEKEKIENNHFKLPIQNEFLKIFKSLFKVEIPKKRIKDDKITKILINILDSIYFDVVITLCVIAYSVILMMNFPGNDKMTTDYIQNMTTILNYVFIVEIALKIYVYRLGFFSSGWNILDFVVICETIISLVLKSVADFISDMFDSSLFLALRVVRILRLLRKSESLHKVFNLFINSIPGVINVLILYFLLLYIYSIIGMSFFYNIKYQDIISDKWNYENFLSSLFMLIRVTSGEGWNTIMHESTKDRDGFFFCKYRGEMSVDELYSGHLGCGTIWGFVYYISFVILSTMMFLEFFSVVIASAMNDTYVLNLEELKQGQINKFKTKWANYDKNCTGFMRLKNFQKFLYGIGHPLGITSLKVSDYIRLSSLLNIYTYTYQKEKYVFFYDVLVELTKYYLIHKTVEDEWNTSTSLFNNSEDILENKAESFINYMIAISEMQDDHKYQTIHPFYLNKKYSTNYILDKTKGENKFLSGKKRTAHFTWAVQKLSLLVKCYKHIKRKTKAVIDYEEYNGDLFDYASKYMNRLCDLKNPNVKKQLAIKRKEIHQMNQSIIKEETEKYSSFYNDKCSSSNSNISDDSENEKSIKKDFPLLSGSTKK